MLFLYAILAGWCGGYGIHRLTCYYYTRQKIDQFMFFSFKRQCLIQIILLCIVLIVFYSNNNLLSRMILLSISVWLLLLSVIDIEHYLLPDCFTYSFIASGLLMALLGLQTCTINESLIGAMLGFILLFIPAYFFKKIRGYPGLGGGDIKLMAGLGTWIPPIYLANTLLIACFLAILFFLFSNHRDQKISFGPFLALAGWFTLLYIYSSQSPHS